MSGTDAVAHDVMWHGDAWFWKAGGSDLAIGSRNEAYVARCVASEIVRRETMTHRLLLLGFGANNGMMATHRHVNGKGADFGNARLFWNGGMGVFRVATGMIDWSGVVSVMIGGVVASMIGDGVVEFACDAHVVELEFVLEAMQAQHGNGPCRDGASAVQPLGDGAGAALE
jgi:hypothetical protein